MPFVANAICYTLFLLVGLTLCGCSPSSHSQVDDEKEPHFVAGKNLVNSLDYDGALECFEKALEVNPRSGLAHFEAGLIYEKQKQDSAAAIYHFERFLKYRPKSGYADYAEVVNQHILACKQELAKTVQLGPVTQTLQKEFEILVQKNKTLQEEVDLWRAKAKVQPGPEPSITTAEASRPQPSATTSVATMAAGRQSVSNSSAGSSMAATPTLARTHVIKSGETPSAIARKYGLRVEALMAANPRMDARHLQVGQSLSLPLK